MLLSLPRLTQLPHPIREARRLLHRIPGTLTGDQLQQHHSHAVDVTRLVQHT
jgi:hypothetical protein